MRRRFFLLSFLIALASPGALQAQVMVPPAVVAPSNAPAGDRLERIRTGHVLRVGTTGDYKPFSYLDPKTGEFTGMDIDVAKAFAASLGVNVTFVQTSWPKMSADLLAERFDLAMGGVSLSAERAEVGELSHVYLVDGKVALVRRSDLTKFTGLAAIDQPGVRLAVNPGGTNQKFVDANIKRASVKVVESNLSIPELVANGDADVMITDGVEALLAARHDPRLAAADPAHPFTEVRKAYYLHKGDAALVAALNRFLDGAMADGTFARLRSTWIGEPAATK